jgi:DNA-binding MarR family transcriptional regulator
VSPWAQVAVADAADIAADELSGRLLVALGRIVRSTRRATTASLTLGNLSALATVIDTGQIRAGDLAAREGVAPATLSRVIGSLERDGYIERIPDPHDGRSAFLTATVAGIDELSAVRRARAALMQSRLALMDEQRLALLAAALPVLEDLARDELNG